ncbi:unnamed protein product [Anisakis simplex]|uniref:BZIP domain-containing protein n=1 Tax=Anisakis simplex TaxID=6269 RepID=A0A0M3KA18_ANISI|nr:unnamed protein product [Anisakis simplex]
MDIDFDMMLNGSDMDPQSQSTLQQQQFSGCDMLLSDNDPSMWDPFNEDLSNFECTLFDGFTASSTSASFVNGNNNNNNNSNTDGAKMTILDDECFIDKLFTQLEQQKEEPLDSYDDEHSYAHVPGTPGSERSSGFSGSSVRSSSVSPGMSSTLDPSVGLMTSNSAEQPLDILQVASSQIFDEKDFKPSALLPSQSVSSATATIPSSNSTLTSSTTANHSPYQQTHHSTTTHQHHQQQSRRSNNSAKPRTVVRFSEYFFFHIIFLFRPHFSSYSECSLALHSMRNFSKYSIRNDKNS